MKIVEKNIKDLKPADYNARTSTPEQEENLKKSLEKFGVVEPIVWNKRTKNIVGGHFRVRELEKLGIKKVHCVEVDLSEEDEKELNIRLNANTGDWDFDELYEWNLNELYNWGLDLPEKSEVGKKTKKEIKPFMRTHVLISFPPEKALELQSHFEAIFSIEGVEYEQSSN